MQNYILDDCGYAVSDKLTLVGYMWIHTGEGPYTYDFVCLHFHRNHSVRCLSLHTGETKSFCDVYLWIFRKLHHVNTQLIETLSLSIFNFCISRKLNFSASCVNSHICKTHILESFVYIPFLPSPISFLLCNIFLSKL